MDDNRFPSCIFMSLQSVGLKDGLISKVFSPLIPKVFAQSTVAFDLKITIRFGKQRISVPGGGIWFGLKRGELKLKLVNAQMPINKMSLVRPLDIEFDASETNEERQEIESNIAISAGIKTDIKPGVKNKTIKAASTISSLKVYQVSNRGTEKEPIWEFETQRISMPFLNGQMTDVSLGLVEALDKPCHVEAEFIIRGQRDLYLVEAEGLWVKDIGRNKQAALERFFFLKFISKKLQPYISKVNENLYE